MTGLHLQLKWNEILRALESLHKSFEDGVIAAFDWCPSPDPKCDAKTRKAKQASKSSPAVDDLFDIAGTTHTPANDSDMDSDDEDAMFWKGGKDNNDEDMDYTKAAGTAQESKRPQNRCMLGLLHYTCVYVSRIDCNEAAKRWAACAATRRPTSACMQLRDVFPCLSFPPPALDWAITLKT